MTGRGRETTVAVAPEVLQIIQSRQRLRLGQLPVGGDARTRPDTNNEANVNGLAEGRYTFSRTGTRVLSERELESELLKAYRQNPNLVLVLRVEGSAPSQVLVSLLDIAGRNGLTRYRIGTQLPKRR